MAGNSKSIRLLEKWTSGLVLRACPNCGSNNYKIISETMKDGINLPTVICRECSLIYTNPVPPEDLYNLFYLEAYNDFYIHQDSFTPSLKGTPADISKIIGMIHDYLPDRNSDILEVGSGSGRFLYYLAEKYPHAIGIEPGSNSSNAKAVHKLNIIDDFFEAHDFGDQKFNMIIMIHVLEHFYDTDRAISKCRDLLTDNGYMLIEVPNILKPFRSLDHYFLRYVHTVNFSPETVKWFLAKRGFQIIYLDSGGIRGPVPKNIRLVAKKTDIEGKTPVHAQENYKSVIRKLESKRIEWIFFGQFHFMLIGLFRSMRSRLAKSKAGAIIKKLIR